MMRRGMKAKTLGFMAAAVAAVLACGAQGEMDLYLLIGQSNMAGRGVLTDSNRVSADGVFKLDAAGEWQPAEEPIHFDKPTVAGAGLAASFARAMADRRTAPTHCDPGTNFSTFRSWEFALPFVNSTVFFENKKYHSSGLSLETYFNWRNYRMTGDTRFVKNSSGNVELAPYPEGAKPKFSRVKVFSVSGALLVFHTFKDWGISVGPVVNFNTYASLKTRYSIDGGKYKDVEKNINQRKVTFDIMGIIQTPAVDLYLKYSPNSVLKDGVKFRSLTFGFAL